MVNVGSIKKLENNWRSKTLENLENYKYQVSDAESTLVERIGKLRRKPLNLFTIEDLRIMIGQQFGLDYLVPLALEVFRNNLFAEGDLYEGDLLRNVLSIEPEFWDINEAYWRALNQLIGNNWNEITERKLDSLNFHRCKLSLP